MSLVALARRLGAARITSSGTSSGLSACRRASTRRPVGFRSTSPPARGQRGDRRRVRCRIRIEQPLLRAGRPQARHVAVGLSSRGRRPARAIHYRRFGARTPARRRDRQGHLLGGHERLGSDARAHAVGGYPAAVLERDDRGLAKWARAIEGLTSGRAPRGDLPIDVRATAFQWQVWKALAEIPRGETRTYSQVAKAIGRPRAVRAVGHACATNPVAVVIPCHRVVPSTGGVGHNRWGRHGRRSCSSASDGPSSTTAHHEATKITKNTKFGYSQRKATRGSTRLARRAGRYAAKRPTAASSRHTPATTGRSWGLMSKSSARSV